MVTLIAVYDSDGLVGRCDARCYKAHELECACICGGANHGAGLDQAMENTRQLAESWLEEYTREHGLSDWWSEVPARAPVQLSLIEEIEEVSIERD